MRRVIFGNKQSLARENGFTIVELLIVIVVIGVLTTLTVVAYGGIQARTRDTIVKNAAKQLGTQLQRFTSDTGKTPLQTGGGSNGGGTGWVSSQITGGIYTVQIETVLREAGYLPSGFTSELPKNTKYDSSAYTLMLYACGSKYVVFYSLESPNGEDVADFNNVKTVCGAVATSVETSYNMKGGYIFS